MGKKKDINHLHELAAKRGGRCLSVEYINSHTKYDWECDKGHRWKARASNINQGVWCPECAILKNADKYRRPNGLEWLHELASLRGGKCIATEYLNNRTKVSWVCQNGHIWSAIPLKIQSGQWCPVCAGKQNNTKKWLDHLADKNRGMCLSLNFISSQTKYEWECSKKHRFKSTANDVQQGKWCPRCVHKHSKPELQIYEFVKQLYPDAVNGQRKLLFNPRFELDIYIPSLQKAIEYDGKHWHSRPETQPRDLQKDEQCQEVGIQLLRIQEQYFLDCPQQIFDIIKVFLDE